MIRVRRPGFSPIVAAVLDKLVPWSFSPERAGCGGRRGRPGESGGTLGKVDEGAPGVYDRRGLVWGPCDQAPWGFPFCLFSLSLSVPVSYSVLLSWVFALSSLLSVNQAGY